MRIVSSAIVCIAVIAFGRCGAATGSPRAHREKPQPNISATVLARRIHALINRERAKHRLGALAWDDALASVALGHSRDMAQRRYFSHDTPEGQSLVDRYRRDRYRCEIRVGDVIYGGAENIALGRLFNSVTIIDGVAYHKWNSLEQIARETVEGWMHSPGHRHNILTPHWRHEGVGVDVRPDNRVLITQDFC
jgi:uncharacterized protein YkwD